MPLYTAPILSTTTAMTVATTVLNDLNVVEGPTTKGVTNLDKIEQMAAQNNVMAAANRLELEARYGYDGTPELAAADRALHSATQHQEALFKSKGVFWPRTIAENINERVLPTIDHSVQYYRDNTAYTMERNTPVFLDSEGQSQVNLYDYFSKDADESVVTTTDFNTREYPLAVWLQRLFPCDENNCLLNNSTPTVYYDKQSNALIRFLQLRIHGEDVFIKVVSKAGEKLGYINLTFQKITQQFDQGTGSERPLHYYGDVYSGFRSLLPVPNDYIMVTDSGRLTESELLKKMQGVTDGRLCDDARLVEKTLTLKNDQQVTVCVKRTSCDANSNYLSPRYLEGRRILCKYTKGSMPILDIVKQLGQQLLGFDGDFTVSENKRTFTATHPNGAQIVANIIDSRRGVLEIKLEPTKAFDNSDAMSLYDAAFLKLMGHEPEFLPQTKEDQTIKLATKIIRKESLAENSTKKVRFHLLYKGAVPLAVTVKTDNDPSICELSLKLSASYYNGASLQALLSFLTELTGVEKLIKDELETINMGFGPESDEVYRGKLPNELGEISIGVNLDPRTNHNNILLGVSFYVGKNKNNQGVTLMEGVLSQLNSFEPLGEPD